MRCRAARRSSRTGFSLIEVMIAILIVLAIGGLVAYNVLGARDKADERLGTIQLREVQKSLRQFKVNHGRYPTDEEGLRVLWDKEVMTDEEALKNWEKLLEKPMPTDKWGSEWGYRQTSEHGDETTYDLWSFGPDKQEGTTDDIVSWDDAESDGTPSEDGSTKTDGT